MLTKANTANGLSEREAGYFEAIDECLDEMTRIRKRMKATDTRIRRADASIRRTLDASWAILRHVQASR
jgi:hypothetical protein